MTLTSDWHIHSRNSCDEAALVIADLIREAEQKGIRDYGLTDHIHTAFNLPDLAASRREFVDAHGPPNFRFGVEISVLSQWEIDEIAAGRHENPVYGLRSGGPAGGPLAIGLTAEHVETFEIEFVVGGTHWPMYIEITREAVIRDYHRQNMFLATHPLVTIVAHPWWWMGHWKDADGRYTAEPWFDDFSHIPASMHDEFAAACIEHGKVVEINISANLANPHYPDHFKRQYLEYLADLKAKGVTLSVGSDCHSLHYDIDFDAAAAMIESVGIRDEELWRWGEVPSS